MMSGRLFTRPRFPGLLGVGDNAGVLSQAATKAKMMNEWMKVQWFKVHSKAKSRLSLTHLPVQPLSRVKSLDGPRVRVVPEFKDALQLIYSALLITLWKTTSSN